MTNLLLGNGINMKFAKEHYQATAIRKRFREVLLASSALYEALFSIPIDANILEEFDKQDDTANVEKLAEALFLAIKKAACSVGQKDSMNLDHRINAAIKVSALTAIFFEAEKFLNIDIPPEATSTLSRFDQVFTLNYYEFWDTADSRCKYLHGSIGTQFGTVPKRSEKPVLLYDKSRYEASIKAPEESRYSEAVDELMRDYTMYPIVEGEFLFSPSDTDKLQNASLYPSDQLYCAWDLIPAPDHSQDYKALETLDSLSVFGVSPYGDDRLISTISQVSKITVFILNMAKNDKEINVWKKMLTGAKTEYKDADDFWN